MFFTRSREAINSPVLVMDALGISRRIEESDEAQLADVADELDRQFYTFRAKVPYKFVLVGRRRVIGTKEFSTFRLNDMFVLFSERRLPDPALYYMLSASILYHSMLLDRFIPRGGLGFGHVLRRRSMLLGKGFLDAYTTAEKRPEDLKDICGVELSPNFVMQINNTEQSWRLVCLYRDRFYLNPVCLTDPEMGEFDKDRILHLLMEAGADNKKLRGTKKFLENYENYDTAMLPNSRSRQLTGWMPSA